MTVYCLTYIRQFILYVYTLNMYKKCLKTIPNVSVWKYTHFDQRWKFVLCKVKALSKGLHSGRRDRLLSCAIKTNTINLWAQMQKI